MKAVKRILIFSLLILLLGALLPGSSAAAGEDFDLQYRLNFNTGPDYNRWNVLQVTVANRSRADWQGTVEAVFAGSCIEEIFVPAGKKIEVNFFLPPFRESTFVYAEDRVYLSLKDEDGRIIKTARVGGINLREGPAIGVLAGSPEMFDRLATIFPGSRVIHLREEHFEQALFLDGFSLLVLSDTSRLSLQPEQQDYLSRWVERGGMLVLGGGRGWQSSAALLPGDQLPFRPTGLVEKMDLLPFKSTRPFDSYLITGGEVTGRVLLETGAFPLLVVGNRGWGRIYYSTLNLEDAPFTDSATLEDFWQQLLRFGGETVYRRQEYTERYMINELLQMVLQSGHQPFFFSAGQIFAAILAYILLVGPVSFLVLRRLRRWEWAWLTIPALAIFFTVLIYLAAGSGRGDEYTLYQLNFVEMQHENRAAAESYGVLFVPRRGAVAFTSPVAALAPGKGAMTIPGPENATQVSLDDPALWSMQRFYAAQPLQLAGPVQMEGLLGRNEITVTVTNETGHAFFDSWLRFPEGWQQIGSLENGETKTIRSDRGVPLDLSAVSGRYAGRTAFHLHWPEEMLNYPADLLLVGFNDTLPVLEMTGTASAPPLNIFLSGLDLEQLDLQETFAIKEGWLAPRIIGSSGQGIHYHRKPTAQSELYLQGAGQVDLVFVLPPGVDYTAGEYQINAGHWNGSGTVEVLVYNRDRADWDQLGQMILPGGGILALDRIDEQVFEDRLLVRLQYQGELWVEAGRIFSIRDGVRR